MSLGQHHEWKQMCVRYSGVKSGSTALDLCCGSGDLTQMLAKKVGPKGRVSGSLLIQSKAIFKVLGLDFSPEMLKIAKEKDQESQSCKGQIEYMILWFLKLKL